MVDLGSLDLGIHGNKSPGHREIATLADCQHRVVARWQLIALGFGRGAIEHRVRTGYLHPVYRGAFAVGCSSTTPRGRIMAAVLACGDEAIASHHAAALIWGLRQSDRAAVDVTGPRSRHGQPGIKLHRVRALHPDDRSRADGIPLTSVARTIFDLAETLQPHQLANVVTEAEARRLFDLLALERLIERSPGRRGIKPLRELLATYVEPPLTRSELERILLRVCVAAGVARPQMNVIVAGHRVDALWPGPRVVVEVDSRRYHMTVAAFEEDRRRDADLMLAGYRVLRITWKRLRDEPAVVADILRRLLSAG
jgi:very-short-patch-repair endonuclease